METYLSQFPLGNVMLAALFVGSALWVVVWTLRGGAAGWSCVLASIAAFGYLVALCAIFLYLPIESLTFAGDREPILLSTILQMDPFRTITSTDPAGSLLILSAFAPLPAALYVILRSVKRASVLSFFIALLIEPAQLLIDCAVRVPRYVVDIDDILLMIADVTIGLAGLLLIRRAHHAGRRDGVEAPQM